MKKLLALMLVLLMVFGMVACGSDKEGDKEEKEAPELDAQDMAEELVDAMFEPDMEKFFEMAHPDVIEKAKKEAGDEWDTYIEQVNAGMEEDNASIAMYDWSWEVEITKEEELDEDELEKLQDAYDDADIDVVLDQAVAVNADIIVSAEGEEGVADSMELVFALIDGKWYLDMSSFG